MDKDTQLPAEVEKEIISKAQAFTIKGDESPFFSYKAGATEYAIKLLQANEDKELIRMAYECSQKERDGLQAKLDQAEQKKAEWKEECERLAKVAEYWQQEYHNLTPPKQSLKIDNNPIA